MELLRTGRLQVRAWTTSDADLARLEAVYSRTEVTQWLSGPPADGTTRWYGVECEAFGLVNAPGAGAGSSAGA